jgi:hypothetical protein
VTGDGAGGGPALVLRADRLRAARRVLVARQVVLSAAAGDVVAVEGANGSGKSTLLAAAAGVLPTGQAGRRPASVGYAPNAPTSCPAWPCGAGSPAWGGRRGCPAPKPPGRRPSC